MRQVRVEAKTLGEVDFKALTRPVPIYDIGLITT